MPKGKPAGVACGQLDAQWRCKLIGQAARPAVCGSLQPSAEICGSDWVHVLRWLGRLDAVTAP